MALKLQPPIVYVESVTIICYEDSRWTQALTVDNSHNVYCNRKQGKTKPTRGQNRGNTNEI